jgi:hypothetical protein
MENKTQINPFVVLMQHHFQKDIDSNFMETLETLLLLNKNYAELLSEPYILLTEKVENIDEPSTTTSLGELLKKKLAASNHGYYTDDDEDIEQDFYRKTESSRKKLNVVQEKNQYYWSDFLIFKLSENLRRLYAFHKNEQKSSSSHSSWKITNKIIHTSPTIGSKENLLKQQKNIYTLFEKFYPYLKFQEDIKVYQKLFLGKDCKCSSQEALFYLSFHDQISPENIPTHIKLFQSFSLSNTQPHLFNFYNKVSYLDEKRKTIQKILSSFPDQFYINFIQNVLKSKVGSSGSFFFDFIPELAQRNIQLSKEDKKLLLNKILTDQNNLLFHEKHDFADQFYQKIKDYFSDIHLTEDDFFRHGFSKPQSALTKLILQFIPKFENPKLLITNILPNKDLPPNIKNEILSKYDFNQNLILQCFQTMNPSNKEGIHQFISFIKPYLNNEILSLIIANNSAFLPVLKPVYQEHILNNELPKKDETIKKMKI